MIRVGTRPASRYRLVARDSGSELTLSATCSGSDDGSDWGNSAKSDSCSAPILSILTSRSTDALLGGANCNGRAAGGDPLPPPGWYDVAPSGLPTSSGRLGRLRSVPCVSGYSGHSRRSRLGRAPPPDKHRRPRHQHQSPRPVPSPAPSRSGSVVREWKPTALADPEWAECPPALIPAIPE